MYILPDAMLKAMLLAIEGSTTLFPSGFKLHLYTNNHTPVRGDVLANFTELTNTEVPGYAAATPTWSGSPNRNADGSWEDYSGISPFVATGTPPSAQIVYGWYLTDTGATTLLGAGLLGTPFTYVATGDGFRLQMNINVNQTQPTQETVTLNMLQS